jgi:hypothetical protein
MKITKFFRVINLFLAAIFVSIALWEKGLWIAVGITGFWIILWWYRQGSAWDFAPSVFFVGYVGACVVGAYWGLQPILIFLGVTAALNAWDSDRFYRRWKDAEQSEGLRKLEGRHLYRILAVDGLGVILAVAGLSLNAQFNFGIMLLVGVLAVISLSRLISLLRKPGPKI